MPAHPVHAPALINDSVPLLDEEFDIFDITPPYTGKAGIGNCVIISDDMPWDESDNDNLEAYRG